MLTGTSSSLQHSDRLLPMSWAHKMDDIALLRLAHWLVPAAY